MMCESGSRSSYFDKHILDYNHSVPSTPPDLSDPTLQPLINLLPKHVDPNVIIAKLLMKQGGRGWVHPTAFGDFKTKESWRERNSHVNTSTTAAGSNDRRGVSCPPAPFGHEHSPAYSPPSNDDEEEETCSLHRRPSPASSVTSLADLDDRESAGQPYPAGSDSLPRSTSAGPLSIYLSTPDDESSDTIGEQVGMLGNDTAVADHPHPEPQSIPSAPQRMQAVSSFRSYSPAFSATSATSTPSPSTSPQPGVGAHSGSDSNLHNSNSISNSNTRPTLPFATLRRESSTSSLSSSCTCHSQLSTLTRDSSTSNASRTSSIRFAPLPEAELRAEKRRRAAARKKALRHAPPDANSGLELVEKKWAMGVAGRRELLLGGATPAHTPKTVNSSTIGELASSPAIFGFGLGLGPGLGSTTATATATAEDKENLADSTRIIVPPRLDNGEIDIDELDLDFGDVDDSDREYGYGNGYSYGSSSARRKGYSESTLRMNERGELVEKRPLGVTLEELVFPPKRTKHVRGRSRDSSKDLSGSFQPAAVPATPSSPDPNQSNSTIRQCSTAAAVERDGNSGIHETLPDSVSATPTARYTDLEITPVPTPRSRSPSAPLHLQMTMSSGSGNVRAAGSHSRESTLASPTSTRSMSPLLVFDSEDMHGTQAHPLNTTAIRVAEDQVEAADDDDFEHIDFSGDDEVYSSDDSSSGGGSGRKKSKSVTSSTTGIGSRILVPNSAKHSTQHSASSSTRRTTNAIPVTRKKAGVKARIVRKSNHTTK